MSAFRDSKFRHTLVTVSKREQWYESLKPISSSSSSAVDPHSRPLASSSSFLAYIDGSNSVGNAVAVLPLSSVGKNHIPISAPSYVQPLIRGHSGPVSDLAFWPSRPHSLLTTSADATIKLWEIPAAGYVVDCNTPTASLTLPSASPLRGLATHPIADGLVAVRSSNSLGLVDLVSGTASQIEGFTADIMSFTWSSCGKLLAVSCKVSISACICMYMHIYIFVSVCVNM